MKTLYCAPAVRATVTAALTCVAALSAAQAQSQPDNTPGARAVPVVATFSVLEFAVEGNTVMPAMAIEQALAPFLGPGKTISDVEGARIALEKLYQDAGYLTVFVDLPEQSTASGVIRLTVLEGRVERLSVKGSRYFSQGYIRQRVPELAEGKVPNFLVVQSQLADVNRTDDRRVQPILRQGRELGGVEADLKVNDEMPLHGTVDLNNNHGQYTRPWRVMTSLRYENAFQLDHTINLMAITAPQNPQESKAFLLDYIVPLKAGDAWRMTGLYSNSNVDALGAATILGKGYSLGVKRVWGLQGATGVVHSVTAGVDYKNFKERTLAGGSGLYSPVRYAPFNLGYDGMAQHEGGAVSSLTATAVMSWRQVLQHDHNCGFGEQDQFACKRNGADGGFAYLKADARHARPLGSWRVEARVAGQVASQALLGAEQFALTGADMVRGYLAAEVVGDHGLFGSLELHTPNLLTPASGATPAWYGWQSAQLFAFADAGRAWTLNTTAGQAPRQSVASVGIGAEFKTVRHARLSVTWADPLKSAVATAKHHPHLHMALSLDF